MLKTISIIVVILIAAVLLFAATKPDTFRVQRATSIKAPPEKIFPYVNDFRSFGSWSPYEKKDPNMKRKYSGPESGKGAVYDFEGDGNVGSGRLEITDSSIPGKVAMKLDFVKPFETHNLIEFTMVAKGDSTEVTWAMNGPVPYVAKIMHVFFNMDRMIGNDFEAGLANLKAIAEK